VIEKPEIVIACKDAGITNKLAVSFEQVSARLYKPTSRKELLDVVRERFINLAIIDSRLFGVPELVVVKEIKSLSHAYH
jgi:DNA-binding NtrC family response regulator